MAKKKKLADFAAAHKPSKKGPTCWACSIPEAKELAEGRKRGLPVVTMRRWLIEDCGYTSSEATYNKLRDHFVKEHHEQAEVVSD